MTLALADNLINMLFLGADRKLHHLCCVPTSPRWSTSSQSFGIWKWNYKKSPGPFSYTLTALVVEACKLGLSFSCGVFTANCIVNIAITVNFEWVPLSWNAIPMWLSFEFCSLFTSLDETAVMAGVYTIIGLSFAPNAFEYYQVILTIPVNYILWCNEFTARK